MRRCTGCPRLKSMGFGRRAGRPVDGQASEGARWRGQARKRRARKKPGAVPFGNTLLIGPSAVGRSEAAGEDRRGPQPPSGRRSGGGHHPRRIFRVLWARVRGHRVGRADQQGHGVPDRLDHQGLHGDRRDAAVRGRAGGPRRAGQQLPALLRAGLGARRFSASHAAASAYPHLRNPRRCATSSTCSTRTSA